MKTFQVGPRPIDHPLGLGRSTGLDEKHWPTLQRSDRKTRLSSRLQARQSLRPDSAGVTAVRQAPLSGLKAEVARSAAPNSPKRGLG